MKRWPRTSFVTDALLWEAGAFWKTCLPRIKFENREGSKWWWGWTQKPTAGNVHKHCDRTVIGLGPRSVLFGSENQTTETKLGRTKKGRMIDSRLQFYDRITSMYSDLGMRRSDHSSESLNNSKSHKFAQISQAYHGLNHTLSKSEETFFKCAIHFRVMSIFIM